ncbi:hypothetical protein ACIBCT_39040 [Streptosporangium sp. NPDC050855]|uniref:hypothetical protein n=1 Tax=Streptosporangium sp. NPDC050855 TaxID=3366194 RepID=UPI00379B3809
MTLTITRPCALLHITGDEITSLLDAVLAHASQDGDDLAMLRQLHIEVCEGDLRLVCSDRFTMAIARVPLTSTTEDFACTFAVSAWRIRELIRAFEGSDGVTVAIEERRLVVTNDDKSYSIPGEKSELPWRKALGRFLTPAAAPTGRILVNPALLARVGPARALHPDAPLQMQMHGEHGAMVATLGEHFLVIVMPIQNNGRLNKQALPDRPLDTWFDLLDEH